MKYSLYCVDCGATFGSDYTSQICSNCDGILEVKYAKSVKPPDKIESFWDMETVMPEGKYKHLYLGLTPIIKGADKGLLLKLEFMNPTHSFKDRGSAIEVAKAAEYGFKEVVCASTGNMAYSISYYAKLYGMRAKVFISGNANEDKIKDIKSVGDASVVKVAGDFTTAQAMAIKYSKSHKSFLCGDYCYRKEGQKSIAYEIIYSAKETKNIIVPVGNATLLSATYKALLEMKVSNAIKLPRIIAVQSQLCKPLVDAFAKKSEVKYEKPRTKADAIAVGYPTYGVQGIESIKKTHGFAISVTDKEMVDEQSEFLSRYGLIAELASVSTLVAYRKLALKGQTVAVISGSNT